MLRLEGHGGWVWACAVSPDGRRIVSGSDDQTVRVWDAASGESVLTLEGHGGAVSACAVSPDGRRILSGSDDNTLRWLGWLARDPNTGFLERYPAESFGPLPGAE